MSVANHPRAGQPARQSDLINVAQLTSQYYVLQPEAENPAHAVVICTKDGQKPGLCQGGAGTEYATSVRKRARRGRNAAARPPERDQSCAGIRRVWPG